MRVRNILIFMGLHQDKRQVAQAAYTICVIDTKDGQTETSGIAKGRYTRIRLKSLIQILKRLCLKQIYPQEHIRVIFTSGDQELHDIWHEQEIFRRDKNPSGMLTDVSTLKDGDLWIEILSLSERLHAEIVFPQSDSYMGAMIPRMKEQAHKYLESLSMPNTSLDPICFCERRSG